jgi:CO dehydrogenase/acetyl-CoA synthase beta subunit
MSLRRTKPPIKRGSAPEEEEEEEEEEDEEAAKEVQIFSKKPEFSGNVTEHNICVSVFSTKFVRNISHSKTN